MVVPKPQVFPFPSNGKVVPNEGWEGQGCCCGEKVSIPFKRESSSEHVLPIREKSVVEFPFPSNGKVVPNVKLIYAEDNHNEEFQFPSNGKVVPNLTYNDKNKLSYHLSLVSIPFKRESSSELLHKFLKILKICVSIPFKRESSSELDKIELNQNKIDAFPFPSNGKVVPNWHNTTS